MKYVAWLAVVLVVLAASFLGLQTLASERVEVVELYTTDETGEEVITRLWVVDDGGYQYLRVGADGSSWFSRLQANEEFNITRNNETHTYRAVLREDKREAINALMQAKYTWGDSLIGVMVGSREGSIPIELHVVD